MSLHEYPNVEQRSDEWYELRRGIVTASAVGALVTPTLRVADNDTSRALALALVAERITGRADDNYVSADMWRGIEAEPLARDAYSQNHSPVAECGFMRRDEDGWTLGLSPDGLVGDDGLIEIKAPRAKGHIQTILADEVPARHMAQCQAALLVSDREWIDFVSYCGGMPLYVKRVLPDHRWVKAICAAVEAFEQTAAEMVAAYTRATEGLPVTERADLEIAI